MIKLLPILIIIVFGGIAFADPSDLVPYTRAQEKEVKSFIIVGMDEKAVAKKFGPPNSAQPGKDGSEEVWEYFVNPRVVRETHSSYAGFEVFFKDKKVTYLGITRASQN
jgi:hypothetical protein